MPGIYDINFDIQRDNLNSPRKRLPRFSALLHVLFAPLQWLRDRYLGDYINGASYPLYNNGTTYVFNDMVEYDRGIYVCIVASSVGVKPDNIITGNFYKVMDTKIGVYERLAYSTKKLCVEFTLNKYFGSTFRQPPLISDIYITRLTTTKQVLGVANGICRGGIGNDESIMMAGVKNVVNSYNAVSFVINAPNALQVADPQFSDKLTAYASKYIMAGFTFSINLY